MYSTVIIIDLLAYLLSKLLLLPTGTQCFCQAQGHKEIVVENVLKKIESCVIM